MTNTQRYIYKVKKEQSKEEFAFKDLSSNYYNLKDNNLYNINIANIINSMQTKLAY